MSSRMHVVYSQCFSSLQQTILMPCCSEHVQALQATSCLGTSLSLARATVCTRHSPR
jgi:hypothetical protein